MMVDADGPKRSSSPARISSYSGPNRRRAVRVIVLRQIDPRADRIALRSVGVERLQHLRHCVGIFQSGTDPQVVAIRLARPLLTSTY